MEDVSFPSTLSSIAVEKVLDLVTMIVLASFSIMFFPEVDVVPAWVFNILKILALLAAISIIGLLFVSWKSPSIIVKLETYVDVFGRSKTLMKILSSLIKGAAWIPKHPLQFFYSLGLTFVLWLIFSMGTYTIFLSLGISPNPFTIILGTLLTSFAYVLPNVPGYVGTFEGAWLLIFSALGIGSTQIIFAGALIGHIVTTIIIISLGSIAMVKIGISLTETLRMRRYNSNQ